MGKIPEFDSEEDEAKFWETHSLADYEDELEPVELVVSRPLEHRLSVRVSKEDLKELQRRGKESGMGMTTYARFLLRQALQQQVSPDGDPLALFAKAAANGPSPLAYAMWEILRPIALNDDEFLAGVKQTDQPEKVTAG